jgi:hypothetical protein
VISHYSSYLRRSIECGLLESMEARIELELLRRRCILASLGSDVTNPEDRAKRFKISVRETTPLSRPDKTCPGSADADTALEIGLCTPEELGGLAG